MFFGRIKKENFLAKDGMVIMYSSKDGYVYVSFSEKLGEGFEEVTEEKFTEKTKDLYQERPEWETAGKAITQIANENRYGLAILSDNIKDTSKVKVPTAENLKLTYDIACEAKEIVKEVQNTIQNGGGQVITGLKDGSVTTPKLADNAVTNIKIADDSISEEKLKNNCITTDKVKDGAITKEKLSEDVISTINSSDVDVSKIPDGSIESNKMQDGSISEVKLQDNCITTSKIKDGSVTKIKLAQEVLNLINTSSNINIPDNSITAEKIKNIQYLSNHTVIGNGANIKTLDNKEVSESYPCIALGYKTAASAMYSIALGSEATASVDHSIALGDQAKASGYSSTALGYSSKASWYISTAIGASTEASETGSTAIGDGTKASANSSLAIGNHARASGRYSIALGYETASTHDSSIVFGKEASTTTANQIMLGNSNTTPYAYKSLVIVSDKRDKTDIKDIGYNSLDFLNKLKPKQYKMNCRSNYKRDEEISKEEYEKLDEYTKKSHTTKYKIYELENGFRYINYRNYDKENVKKDSDRYKPIFKTKDIFLSREIAETELRKKLRKDGIENKEYFEEKEVGEIILKEVFLESDGSMAGERYHNGFLAQEVEDVAKSMNFDFAGVKYLAHNGDGEDMYGIAYEEFIAPIIASIQELSKENDNLKNKIENTNTENTALKDKIISLEAEQENMKKMLNELANKVATLENTKQEVKEDSEQKVQEAPKEDNAEEEQNNK